MASTTIALLLLINSVRTTPLLPDADLMTRAQARAEQLCDRPFSHAGWTKSFEGTKWGYIGENLARGFSNLPAAHAALMASPSHKRNITSRKYTHFGAGEACGVVVELFGARTKV